MSETSFIVRDNSKYTATGSPVFSPTTDMNTIIKKTHSHANPREMKTGFGIILLTKLDKHLLKAARRESQIIPKSQPNPIA